MHWMPWAVAFVVATCVFVVALLALGVHAARAWGGEAVGAMRVRKWSANGSHDRLRVAVRRSVRGKPMFRDVHVLVGPLLMPEAVILTQVAAVSAAELLERAAAEASVRP